MTSCRRLSITRSPTSMRSPSGSGGVDPPRRKSASTRYSSSRGPRELEYRVEALLRRGGSTPPEPDGERIEVGDLVIDKRRHEVIRNGFRVDLTPLEFQIL